jgi:ribosomal protein S18 acetylase RimI-like enzyme
MRIVRATIDHLDALAPAFDAYRRFFTRASCISESRSFLRERLSNADSVIFLAQDGGNTVGFLQLYPLFSSWYCKRVWFLSDLYVREDARGRGTASALVRQALAYAASTGASSVMVELPKAEPKLYEFYTRFGFLRDGVFDLFRYMA